MTYHTTESLKQKTIEIGDCWEWQGYQQNNTPQICHAGKLVSVRRLFSELLGKKVPNDWYVIAKCENKKCVNPDHFKRLNKKQMAGKAGKSATQSIGKKLKIQKAKQAESAKLNWDIVDEIRSSDLTYRELARKHKVHPSLISKVSRNLAWRRYENNIFAGLM